MLYSNLIESLKLHLSFLEEIKHKGKILVIASNREELYALEKEFIIKKIPYFRGKNNDGTYKYSYPHFLEKEEIKHVMGYFQIMDGDNAGLERICMLLYGNTRTIKKIIKHDALEIYEYLDISDNQKGRIKNLIKIKEEIMKQSKLYPTLSSKINYIIRRPEFLRYLKRDLVTLDNVMRLKEIIEVFEKRKESFTFSDLKKLQKINKNTPSKKQVHLIKPTDYKAGYYCTCYISKNYKEELEKLLKERKVSSDLVNLICYDVKAKKMKEFTKDTRLEKTLEKSI